MLPFTTMTLGKGRDEVRVEAGGALIRPDFENLSRGGRHRRRHETCAERAAQC
jgi:hypothetical protein